MAFLAFTALSASSCGVRQYNAKHTTGRTTGAGPVQAYGPYPSAGQVNGSVSGAMSTNPAACGSAVTGSGRPCIKARASIGMPYQFDVNKNDTQGPILTGSAFPAPAPYAAPVAGAGRTSVSSGPRGPNFPRAANKDLKLMQKQAGSADYVF